MRKWKKWEAETASLEYQFSNDPSRFRFTHQTSFVKRHMGLSSITGVRWIVSLSAPLPDRSLVIFIHLDPVTYTLHVFVPGCVLQAVLHVRHKGRLPHLAPRLHQRTY